jgi:hypothetical protein
MKILIILCWCYFYRRTDLCIKLAYYVQNTVLPFRLTIYTLQQLRHLATWFTQPVTISSILSKVVFPIKQVCITQMLLCLSISLFLVCFFGFYMLLVSCNLFSLKSWFKSHIYSLYRTTTWINVCLVSIWYYDIRND